jgi:hypothetical protein
MGSRILMLGRSRNTQKLGCFVRDDGKKAQKPEQF